MLERKRLANLGPANQSRPDNEPISMGVTGIKCSNCAIESLAQHFSGNYSTTRVTARFGLNQPPALMETNTSRQQTLTISIVGFDNTRGGCVLMVEQLRGFTFSSHQERLSGKIFDFNALLLLLLLRLLIHYSNCNNK